MMTGVMLQRWARLLMLGFVCLLLGRTVQAQSDEDLLDAIGDLLEQGGADDYLPPILRTNDPQKPPGYFAYEDGIGYIVLNFGIVKQWVDQIRASTGYDLPLDSPLVLGYFLYICLHEKAHSDCCHDGSGNTPAEGCREVLADIVRPVRSHLRKRKSHDERL